MSGTSTPGDPSRTCLGCPSYLTNNAEILSRFGKVIGSPMCARYGHVLGRPKATPEQNAKTAQTMAANCPSHGRVAPHRPERIELKVAIPDPDAISNPLSDLDQAKQSVVACGMCKHFVPDEVVHLEHGWTAGLCAAKGKLILPNRKQEEARGCDYRAFRGGNAPLSSIPNILIPALTDMTAQAAVNQVGDFMRGADSVVDPKDYPTDVPVSPEDQMNGIRAWRRIVDPSGSGNEVYLPIFDEKFFTEEERAEIPQTGSDEHPELYLDWNGGVYKIAVIWRELDETPMLWGQAGVGKTEFAQHMAWLMQLPFVRVSITGSTELDDLAGKMRYSKEKGTYFQYGRISTGWTKPCVMLIDEPNTGQPEVWEFIRPMTDNSKKLTLDMNEGETLRRHEFTHLILAANPAWDPLNVGANVIGDADASRLMHFEYSLPPENIERAILQNRVLIDGWKIDSARLDFIMEVAKLIRNQCKEGALSMTWGLRPQIKVARALAWFPAIEAYKLAVADMLSPEQQEIVFDQVKLKQPRTPFPPVERVE